MYLQWLQFEFIPCLLSLLSSFLRITINTIVVLLLLLLLLVLRLSQIGMELAIKSFRGFRAQRFYLNLLPVFTLSNRFQRAQQACDISFSNFAT